MGHGVEDEKVGLALGREAAGFMRALGAEVGWREYEGLGHWYSGELLADLAEFMAEAFRNGEGGRS
jgi:predicted esterase